MIYLFFLCSGFSALVYEVAWLRQLCLSFGSTAEATSCVLAIFLGALALGAALGGKLADRLSAGHLAVYGALELGVGVLAPLSGLALYWLPTSLTSGDAGWGRVALTMILATLILSPPTMLMGASLPVLSKLMAVRADAVKGFSTLYAVNTLGAVFGSLSACFLGFALVGIYNTILLAAGVNIVVGLAAILRSGTRPTFIAKPAETEPADRSSEDPPAKLDGGAESLSSADFVFLCIISFLSGFTALGYEVLWSRLLRFYTESTTYSFTITVSSFLLGLAAGSFICRRFQSKARSYSDNLLALASAQTLTAIFCTASLLFLPMAAMLFRTGATQFFKLSVIGLALVALPAVAIGLSFPLIGGLATKFKHVGTSVGTVYAVNSVGCVIGSLVVGLVAQPAVGSFDAFKLNILLTALVALLAHFRSGLIKGPIKVLTCFVPPLLALGLVIACHDPLVGYLKSMTGPTMAFYGEDSTGIALVMKHPDFEELRTNSAAVSSTRLEARRYMRLLGTLPVLACSHPAAAMVACFGTGTTSGATAAFPEVEHLDIVELSPMVIKAGGAFAESNLDVLHNPKVTVHTTDARNFLLSSTKKYDVITFEPPPLNEAGVVNLYSQEFYQIVSRRLTKGGVTAQWVPMFYESGELWKMTLRAFLNVFPYCSLWITNNDEAIILGSLEPLVLDVPRMQRRIGLSDQLCATLSEVGLKDPYDILSAFVAGGGSLEAFVGNVPPITDDRPSMEFNLPYAGKPLTTADLMRGVNNPAQNLVDTVNPKGMDRQKLAVCYQALSAYRESEQLVLERATAEEVIAAAEHAVRIEPTNRFYLWWQTTARKWRK
ncbi:MAG: hypothetical protein K2W95_02110 [Candidatus Obscuribacterales bacterium]|nr:hypothetical protein [Candidatus Obscuribacterales bacterium]